MLFPRRVVITWLEPCTPGLHTALKCVKEKPCTLQTFHAGYSGSLGFPKATQPEKTRKLRFYPHIPRKVLKLSLKTHNAKDVGGGVILYSVTCKSNLWLVTKPSLSTDPLASLQIKEI